MTYRVAMVGACPYPVPQGSQVLLRDTALAVRARGHDVHLLVYGYGIGEDHSGLPIHRCAAVRGARKTAAGPSWAKPLLDLAMVRALRRLAREQHIQLVHAHNYEGLVVALGARKRPVIYHAHNAMADELPYYFDSRGARAMARRLGRRLDLALPRRADHVIAPHAALAEYLIACGCRPAAVSIVPPSAPVDAFDEPRLADAMPAVLYTGNLDAYQNLAFLDDVMRRVRAVHPEARLTVACNGACPLSDARVVPTPGFEELRAVLSEDAVVVVPRVSWSGYPIKLLNAMAAGRAIVACQSAAHPLRHEENGLTAPDGDGEAFARAVLRLLADAPLRKRLGTAARRTAEEHHAPSAVAEAIERVYKNVMDKRATPVTE